MNPARGLAVLVSFVFFISLSAFAEAPKSDGVQKLMIDTGGTAKIRVDEDTGYAKFVQLPKRSTGSAAITSRAMRSNHSAREFLRTYSTAFGIENVDTELMEMSARRDVHGNEHVVFAQSYEGIPVFGGELRAHFDPNGELAVVNGTFVSKLKVNITPNISEDNAAARAVRVVLAQQFTKSDPAGSVDDRVTSFDESRYADLVAVSRDLVIFREGLVRGTPGADHLAYEVEVRNAGGSIREFVFIDAHSGKLIDQITGIHDALDRRAFDAEGAPHPGPNYPGSPFWLEGDALPTTDVEADNMINASKETYDLFANAFGRDSFDGLGATMDAIFNRGDACPNASWNGTYISFCEGLTSDDVTGHEWGHAYTQYTNNLIYQWQSGALNESYSDIWGEVVDLLNGRGTDDAPGVTRSDGACSAYWGGGTDDSYRWLMGEDVDSPDGLVGALRDMWNPTCLGDPGKVSDGEYWCGTGDNGGVHFNSGVPNHAFTLMVDGGTYNGESVTGVGLTKAAHIEWAAQNLLTLTSNFIDNADALEAACSSLIGVDLSDLLDGTPSGEMITAGDCAEVTKAVSSVEMRMDPTSQCGFEPILDPVAPALCENLGDTQTVLKEDFEGGAVPAGWSVSSYGVVNSATFDSPGWDIVGDAPAGNAGLYAAFAPDLILGNCLDDSEAGVVTLESPDIDLPAMQVPHVAFDHYIASEADWDGGNLQVSVNGGPWTAVPGSDYAFNPYNGTVGFDNPLAGQEVFTGANIGGFEGSWGQSQVNLFGLALPGDTVKLRFDFGTDGCNGLTGWYVDNVHVYSCSAEPLPVCGDGQVDPGEMCDDGNPLDGDGCSASCGVENGWSCTGSTPPSNSRNILADWGFEGGVPNADWTPFSTFEGIPGFPIYADPNLARSGSWVVWIGGLAGGVTSNVTQSVIIPPTASELTINVWRGLCDDASDTLHVSIDGSDIGSLACDGTDSGYVEYVYPLTGYNDGGTHELLVGGTVGGINATHTNFFVDDLGIEDTSFVPGTPSSCSRFVEDLSCNVGLVGFQDGIGESWAVVDNETTGVVWTDIGSSGELGNYTGSSGDAATVSSDAFGPAEFDTELRSNSFNLSKAKAAAINYKVNYQNFGNLDFLDLDVSTDGGSTWTNLLSWNEDHGGFRSPPGEVVSVNLSAYLGEPDVQLRWRYYDPNAGDWDWYAQVDDASLACDLAGRMSGGGMVKQNNVKYTHNFTLRCDDASPWNWMQIKWGNGWRNKKKFRLTELTSAVCSEQPDIDAAWPKAGFNTFKGAGNGVLNGEPATINFEITDAGEPGRNDEIRYTITGDKGVSVSGKLKWGNHQAHKVWYPH